MRTTKITKIIILIILYLPFIITAQGSKDTSNKNHTFSIKTLKKYIYISTFSNNYSVVCIKDSSRAYLYGLINKDGTEIIPPKYEGLSGPTKRGYLIAYNNKKAGIIDIYDNVIIPFEYRSLDIQDNNDYVIYNKGNLIGHGVMNYKRQILFSNLNNYPRMIVVGKNIFATNTDVVYSNDKLSVLSSKCVFIDEKQNVLKSFPNFAAIINNIGEGLFQFKSKLNDKYGAMDARGNEIIKPIYDEMDVFSDGLLRVNIRNYYGDTYDNQYGFIDKTGKAIIPLVYEKVGLKFKEGLVEVRFDDKGYKWGFMDKNQNTVIQPLYVNCEGFSNGLAKIETENRTSSFIDKTGNKLFTFDEINSFNDGLSIIKIKGKYAIIDNKGSILLVEDDK